MNTYGFIVHVQTNNIYKDTAENVETRLTLQILNQADHYLKKKIKKVIGLMKNELGGKIMKEFVGLRAKRY